MKNLNKDELLKLIYSYSNYVHEFFNEHDNGSIPVCIMEYFENDYEQI